MHRLTNRQLKVAILTLRQLNVRSPQRLNELAEGVGLRPSSLSRHTQEFERLGILKRDTPLGGYEIGPKAGQYLRKWGIGEYYV